MLRRYSKARSAAVGSMLGDSSCNLKTQSVEAYEKRVQDLSKGIEESKRNAEQVNLERAYSSFCIAPCELKVMILIPPKKKKEKEKRKGLFFALKC